MNFLERIQDLPRTKSMQKTQPELSQDKKRKSCLDLVRGLPERNRKIILWTVIIITGFGLLSFSVKNFQKRVKDFKVEELKKELNLPKIELPNLELPSVNNEQQ